MRSRLERVVSRNSLSGVKGLERRGQSREREESAAGEGEGVGMRGTQWAVRRACVIVIRIVR